MWHMIKIRSRSPNQESLSLPEERKGLSDIFTTYPGWYGGLLSVSHGLVTTTTPLYKKIPCRGMVGFSRNLHTRELPRAVPNIPKTFQQWTKTKLIFSQSAVDWLGLLQLRAGDVETNPGRRQTCHSCSNPIRAGTTPCPAPYSAARKYATEQPPVAASVVIPSAHPGPVRNTA